MKSIKNNRVIGLDIAKIVAMLMVTALHVLGTGGAADSAKSIKLKIVLSFVEGICFCCINIFAMSTGFLYYGKNTKLSKLFQMWIQVVAWAAVTTLAVAVYRNDISILKDSLTDIFFVTTRRTYWYFSSYFILFLMIPLINKAIQQTDKKYLLFFIIALMLLFGIGTYSANKNPFAIARGYSFAWIAYMFVIGAVIKKYELHRNISKSAVAVLFVVFALIQGGLAVSSRVKKIELFNINYSYSYHSYDFLSVIVLSVLIFIICLNINIKSDRIRAIISKISSATFTVYLLQCSPKIFDLYIKGRFGFIGGYKSVYAIPLTAAIVLGIYIIGTVGGLIQIKLFSLLRIDRLCDSIEKQLNKLYSRFLKKSDT